MVQKKYWAKVWNRAKGKSKEKDRKFNLILFIIITLSGFAIHWLIAGRGEAVNELVVILIYAVVALFLTPTISLVWILIHEPAIMYEELGGFIDKPIIISPESHPGEMGDTNYWRGLEVYNQSPFDVEECMLRLMEATNLNTGESLIRREENLTWSNREKESSGDQPKTIPGNLPKICDFAGRVLFDGEEERKAYLTLAFGPHQIIPIGRHTATIRISGKWQGHNFNYTEELPFYYDGIRLFLGEEVPDE